MISLSPISVDDCRKLSRKGLSEPAHVVCKRERADGAILVAHDNAEVVVLDDQGLGKKELWVEVISRGDDIGHPVGSFLKIKVVKKRVHVLEYSDIWPIQA